MAGSGRPKKHTAEDLHFKSDEAVVERPTMEPEESTGSESTDSTTSMESPPIEPESDMAPSSATSTESPVEERIHQMVEQEMVKQVSAIPVLSDEELNGWHRMDSAPLSGLTVKVSDLPVGDGIDAFYKRTHVFNGKKYEPIGKWVIHLTGVDLPYAPEYWRERY